MKNVHLIPTDKPSRLILQNTKLLLSKYKEVNEGFSEFNQNIYITNDEEIKERDWVIAIEGIWKNTITKITGTPITDVWRKIILSTDQDLIEDGIQAIDDEFLKWFIKNPSCESVEVKFIYEGFEIDCYKIIIPQEEPKTNLDRLPFPELVEELANYYKEVPLVEEHKQETRKNRLLEELIEDIKNRQSFLKSIRKNPQLYYYKLGNCIYERLYNNNNCFEMQDPYGGQSSKMEQELINLKAEKIYYE